jgi:hypothetical protein
VFRKALAKTHTFAVPGPGWAPIHLGNPGSENARSLGLKVADY